MSNRELNLLRFDEEDFLDKILEYNTSIDRGGEYDVNEVSGLAGDYVPEYKDDLVTNALHMIVRYNGMMVISVSYIFNRSDFDIKEQQRIKGLIVRRIMMIISSRGLPYIKASVANNPTMAPYDFIKEDVDKGFLPRN